MKVTAERLENCQVNVFVELDAAEADQKLRETARRISRKYTVPGYRRGKAPFQAVIRAFGREIVQQEALDEFGQEWYEAALKEIEFEPYEMGELKEVEWEPFRMRVLLPIKPEVDLGNYRTVRIPYAVPPVTDEQIEAYLAELQKENAQWVPAERPAALGDQVVIDVEGTVGDESVLSHENYELPLDADSQQPLPGFSQEIVGMSAGDEKQFVLAVPDDDPRPNMAGQQVAIRARLHTVKELDLPPLDDELAMMLGDYDTLEALRAGLRQGLEAEAVQRANNEYLDKALEALVESAVKIEYPPQAVDRELNLEFNRMGRNLASSGISMEAFLRMIGRTEEAYKEQMRPAAEKQLRKRLVIEQVAKLEGIKAQPAEVEGEIERLSGAMGEQADEMKKMLESPMGRLSVADDLVIEQAQQRIIQIVKGEAPSPEAPPESGAEPPQAELDPGGSVQPEEARLPADEPAVEAAALAAAEQPTEEQPQTGKGE